MDIETKLEIIKSEPFEEVITGQDLRAILEGNDHPRHYLGLEISGMMHLGSLFLNGKKINDFEKAGIKTNILLADWHTMANNKFGGDWDKIIRASEFYRKAFEKFCPKTKIILGSDLYKGNDEYWKRTMQFARRTTMARATRTLVIQGRSQTDTLHVSQYIYPMMQVADILALDVDIPHAGMDQRKIHVLAKELFKDEKLKTIAPIHHHLLPSLLEPPKLGADATKEEQVMATKMSKSKPGSAILIMATDDEIRHIIKSAWCPVKVTEHNPVLELCKYLVLPLQGKLQINRKREYGGDIEYTTYAALENDYRDGKLHPMDLKNGITESIISIIKPIRDEFEGKKDLLEVFR
ncbi:MAG: tyrosine--tRNA ligase [Candidatus Micrarchaeota archaeon]|nr:tyrosine--tRNA ligase [Candidatus Micrarchaeota archaeon]